MREAMKRLVMFVCLLVAACSGAMETHEPGHSETVDVDYDDERADSSGSWKAKTRGFTLWVDTEVSASTSRRQVFYTVRGRVSKNLTGVRAYDETGYHYAAVNVSDRKFEVTLDASDLLRLLSGRRLYFDFFPKSGAESTYHGMTAFAPRLGSFAGSTGIFVHRAVNPVLVGDELKFRGRIKTAAGYEMDFVYTDDDAGPLLRAEGARAYRFDWAPAELILAGDRSQDPVYFRAADTAQTPVEKTAHLHFRLVQVGVGTHAPLQAWPPAVCAADVARCLAELPNGDTEECGWASQVRACAESVPPSRRADAAAFEGDLEAAIRVYFADHAADVAAANGRTLTGALRAVDEANVGLVDRDEVDALGFDPDHHDAFFHPDPVYRDSPTIWYGVYDHGAELVAMFTVN